MKLKVKDVGKVPYSCRTYRDQASSSGFNYVPTQDYVPTGEYNNEPGTVYTDLYYDMPAYEQIQHWESDYLAMTPLRTNEFMEPESDCQETSVPRCSSASKIIRYHEHNPTLTRSQSSQFASMSKTDQCNFPVQKSPR